MWVLWSCVHCWLSAINWFWHGSRTRQTLAWVTLFNRVLVRRPALLRFRPYLGRSEAGGKDSMCFPMSACKLWHKKETRVYGCQVVSILLMKRWSLIRTRSRTRGDADADRAGLQMKLHFFHLFDITDTVFCQNRHLQSLASEYWQPGAL